MVVYKRNMMKQKIRLIERYVFTPNSKDIILYDTTNESLKEAVAVEGKDFYGLAKIKNVPISNYDKNSNGRTYPFEEWTKAVKEKTKTYCFADHPEDGKETVNSITGIWENIKVTKDDVRGDLVVFNNENGRTLLHCAKNGLCEFSTSGWGNLDEDNVVTDFELERASDWVYNRSNPVAVITDKSKEVEILENDVKISESFSESITNINKNKMEDGIMENTDLRQFNENMVKNQKNHIKRIIKESEKSGDYANGIEELQGLEPYNKELGEMMSNSVSEMSSKLSEKTEIILKESEKAKGEVSKLAETVKKQDVIIAKLKESLEKANKIMKSKGSSDKLSRTIVEMAKDLDEVFCVLENKTIKSLGIEKPQEFVALAEDSIKMEKLLKQFKERYKNLKESMGKNDMGTSDSNTAKAQVRKYKEALDDALFDLDVLAQILEKKKVNILKEAKIVLKEAKAKEEADDEEVEDDEVEDDEKEVAEKSKKKAKKEAKKSKKEDDDEEDSEEEDEEELEEEEDDDEASDDEEDEDEVVEKKAKKKKEAKKKKAKKESDDDEDDSDEEEIEESDDDDEDDEDGDSDPEEIEEEESDDDEEDEDEEDEVAEKSKKKAKKETAIKKISTAKKLVKAFYEEKVKYVPSIRRIKTEILESKSLTEAYKLIEKYVKPENERMKIKESSLRTNFDAFSDYE